MLHCVGVFGRNDVYANVTGWESFEPWISRIENFSESLLWPIAEQVPPEWYDHDQDELDRLLSSIAGAPPQGARPDPRVQELVAKSLSELASVSAFF